MFFRNRFFVHVGGIVILERDSFRQNQHIGAQGIELAGDFLFREDSNIANGYKCGHAQQDRQDAGEHSRRPFP